MEALEHLQADVSRMAKLKQLSSAGMIDRQASYFNHLIDIYGDVGRPSTKRTFTDRERERVDVYLADFAE